MCHIIGAQLSLVERLVWDQNVAGSNPATPTILVTGGVYMSKDKHIWENNLEFAQVIDEILADKHLYSHDALCDFLANIATYLRQTGHELERYDRRLQVYLEAMLKLP